MRELTQAGQLCFGLHRDGVWHKDFEMRLATLEEVECAIEAAGEDASAARINRHKWAQTLLRLGTLTAKDITADVLAELEATEYGIFTAAEEDLRKKLTAASAAPAGTSA